jgi:uncharacterized membrane protein (DUF373 family)
MRGLVLVTAYFLLVLFLIGVFDLILGLYELLTSGRFTDPLAVIDLLNSVLLLLIIVEVHRTLLAYVREEPIIRIVIGTAIIAIAREVIGFRVDNFETASAALASAGAFSVLIVVLILAYLAVWRIQPDMAGTG